LILEGPPSHSIPPTFRDSDALLRDRRPRRNIGLAADQSVAVIHGVEMLRTPMPRLSDKDLQREFKEKGYSDHSSLVPFSCKNGILKSLVILHILAQYAHIL
jgi:hypothetical protein